MQTDRFSKSQLQHAKALLKAGHVKPVLFSEGTYQVEVVDSEKETHWPFLQLDPIGNIIDCFCSCQEAEKKKFCVHLAAAYLKIFNKELVPLHIRFRNSLWNYLCNLANRRHGYEPSILKEKKNKEFEAESDTHKKLFSIKGLNAFGKKRIQEILFHRVIETEETSLKFSNLSPDEIALWKAGNPSHALQYELCFWSDLAKWMMALQEEGDKYLITFEKTDKLPRWIHIQFTEVQMSFYIAEANWPGLIPTLSSVDSSLKVYEFQEYKIQEIIYDVQRRSLFLSKESIALITPPLLDRSSHSLEVGEWLYVKNVGFFPKRIDPIFKLDEIPSEKISYVLQKHPLILQKFLVNTEIHLNPIKAQYHIYFDEDFNLHISCYLFEVGDLQKKNSAFFGPWVYLDEKGFYPVENLLFNAVEKIVPKSEVSHFVNHHRVWLGGFEGFQTHVSTVESQMHFHVSKEGVTTFEASVALVGTNGEMVDLGELVYLKNKGFFAKELARGAASIRPGQTVQPNEISTFIRVHRDELEMLKDFFSYRCPLEKGGLTIFLNENKRILVRPHFDYFPTYNTSNVKIFGEYTYVEGQGFCEIPHEKRLPEGFTQEKIITAAEEPYFVLYELDALEPFILSTQNELKKPTELSLNITRLQKSVKTKAAEWLLEATFESEFGSVDLFEVWNAVIENKRYLFSQAGLIYLKNPRFNWLKSIAKRKWMKKGKQLRLSTLEWLKLTVFENLKVPSGNSASSKKTRLLIEELTSFNSEKQIDLAGFKSQLRSYQEVGVKWLFFLYLHGLSGMLCDEMGLGKTHQAMGLIAACSNAEEERKKILVVCPTSVIYHWEDLLKKFLPALKVFVFYGTTRNLERFSLDYDLLLTSYGTLRSEQSALSQIHFEIAIFDELQIAKNAQSQIHRALKKIKCTMRVGLSGTPIENRLLELKALFDIVVPGYFPQEMHFKEFFVNPIEKGQDQEKKMLLAKLIKPFMLRRKKSEVLLELPEKIEEISYCDLSSEQKELYKETYFTHKKSLLQDLQAKEIQVPLVHVFSLLSTLKQICDHPCLITKDYDAYENHHSGKWDLFVALLEQIRDSGQKVVVFSQYLDMLNIIEKYLKKKRIGYAGIRGATRNRKEQLEKFKNDPKCEVFVASLQAVGVGVDLVSASVVIHYDRWWNPARENQATDRVHRIGQNRGVQVFKLVTKSTIEEHIHQLIEKKLQLTEGVLGFDDQDHIKGLDKEEVLRLLWLIDKDLETDLFQ